MQIYKFFSKNLCENRRNAAIIIGTICCLIIVVCIVCVSLLMKNTCNFLDSHGEIKQRASDRKVVSENYDAMLRLSSWFTYKSSSGDYHYMAQEVDRVESKRIDQRHEMLLIYMDCSVITFHLKRDGYKNLYTDQIDFELANPDGPNLTCQINKTIFWAHGDEHYNCEVWDSLDCTNWTTNDLFIWEVETFEFETDGQKELTKKYLWTTHKTDCGRDSQLAPTRFLK